MLGSESDDRSKSPDKPLERSAKCMIRMNDDDTWTITYFKPKPNGDKEKLRRDVDTPKPQ